MIFLWFFSDMGFLILIDCGGKNEFPVIISLAEKSLLYTTIAETISAFFSKKKPLGCRLKLSVSFSSSSFSITTHNSPKIVESTVQT